MGRETNTAMRSRIKTQLRKSQLFLALAACFAFAGCGAKTQTASSITTHASLQLSSRALSFGNVSVGQSVTSNLTISNPPGADSTPLTVSEINVSGGPFSVKSASPLPLALAAGQSSKVRITFAPRSVGTANANVSIAILGSATPASLTLSGTGLAATEVAASPSSMSFGGVVVGNNETQPGMLKAGTSSVTISSAAWSGAGFSLSGITFPVTLQPGQSVPFRVNFAPQSSGNATGQISFVSDAIVSPTIVSLSGTGTQPAPHSVSLTWSAAASAVIGYNIYRGTAPGTYQKQNSVLISGLSFTDSSVQNGSTYYYVATAVDSSGVESAYSNLATAVIP